MPRALKYLIVNFHDTNLSNILRFLGFFESNGYFKYVMFSSSLRFELLQDKNSLRKDDYSIRIVFDNEEIKIPICKDLYCSYEEFSKYMHQNLILEYSDIEKYCQGEVAGDFDFDIKYTK